MAELCGKTAKAGVRHFPVMGRFPVMYGMGYDVYLFLLV